MVLNQEAADYFERLQARDEVGTAFLDSLKSLGACQVKGDLRRYRAPYAIAHGVVFAAATGMSEIHYLLPPEFVRKALASGGHDSPVGRGWVAFTLFRADWPRVDVDFWSLKAYDSARSYADWR